MGNESQELSETQQSEQKTNGAYLGPDSFSLDDYAGEIVTHWWTPDKANHPDKKVRLDIRIRALKSANLNLVNKRISEQRRAAADIEFAQQRLTRCKPPREIDRLQKQLDEVRDSDFTDDPDPRVQGYKSAEDKAEEKRLGLEKKIKTEEGEYKAAYDAIGAEIDRLTSLPTFYEILRREFFVKVIDDHSILWHGPKLDFAKPSPVIRAQKDLASAKTQGADEEALEVAQKAVDDAIKDEPPTAFAGGLYTFLLEVLGDEKKASKRNGGSVNQSKHQG